MKKLICIFSILLITACTTTSSLMEHDSSKFFRHPPSIIKNNNSYFIKWKYADPQIGLFFMTPSFKEENNKLLVYIPATSSSGYLNNQYAYFEISRKFHNNIKQDSAFWINPDKSLFKLKITDANKEDLKRIKK